MKIRHSQIPKFNTFLQTVSKIIHSQQMIKNQNRHRKLCNHQKQE